MRAVNRHRTTLFCGAALLAAASLCAATDADTVASAWDHHHVKFSYSGFTTLYTCNGLEDKVEAILLYFGARKDVKVNAGGCPSGPGSPSRIASVDADFYTLVPRADASPAETVAARWSAVKLAAQRPEFMGHGDCELIAAMKDLLAKNFSLRGLDYRTQCLPHEMSLADYSVQGEALKMVPPASLALH